MTTLDDLLRLHGSLTAVHVERWVARGLLRPTGGADSWTFETIDVARTHLLAELTGDLGLDDETVEMVIDLVDQVHTLARPARPDRAGDRRTAGGDPRGDCGGSREGRRTLAQAARRPSAFISSNQRAIWGLLRVPTLPSRMSRTGEEPTKRRMLRLRLFTPWARKYQR